MLLGAGQALAAPPPRPLEVRLDLASAVVSGEVTRVEEKESEDGTLWVRTTVAVKETLKGAVVKSVESRLGYRGTRRGRMYANYAVDDSGIWLTGEDGRIVFPYGHLEEAQKANVQRILKMLSERKWSDEVNGLKA